MKHLKLFEDFINEVSGTELVGAIGPAYGDTTLPNKTLQNRHTNIIYSDLDGKFYTIDEYQDLYQNWLKNGGKPLDGFTKDNIDTILSSN